jgi:site-specific DNA-adenine methylase
MKYVGSKNRLAKELAPIIQSYITDETKGYIEPFVGGANMIDKIKCEKKYGCDIHEELIELLKYVQDLDNELPQHISEEEYIKVKDNKDKYPKWYVGLVGFCATFGAKYFGGYARSFKADGVTPRNQSNESIRNIEKQRVNLQGIKFINKSFLDLDTTKLDGYVIYCDIPYKGTLKYSINEFPYDKFYDWCLKLSKNNIVLISEYNMPEDKFECIWEKEHKVLINSAREPKDVANIRIEKLFTVRKDI